MFNRDRRSVKTGVSDVGSVLAILAVEYSTMRVVSRELGSGMDENEEIANRNRRIDYANRQSPTRQDCVHRNATTSQSNLMSNFIWRTAAANSYTLQSV